MRCTICGRTDAPAARWPRDVCQDCFQANVAQSLEARLHEELAPARAALEAYVSSAHQMTMRQHRALMRLAARWDAEARS